MEKGLVWNKLGSEKTYERYRKGSKEVRRGVEKREEGKKGMRDQGKREKERERRGGTTKVG